MRVFDKMSMMTTLSLCVSCELSRVVFVYEGGAPTFFLNRALLRLNPDLMLTPIYGHDDADGDVYCTADRPVGVGQLDDRQLPARGIVHAQSPCFCRGAPAPRCYCMSNFTYASRHAPLPRVNTLASSERLKGCYELYACVQKIGSV